MSNFTTIDASLLDAVSGGATTNVGVNAGVTTPAGVNANVGVTTSQTMSEYNQCLKDRAGEMAWGTSNQERSQIQQQLCAPILSTPGANTPAQ